MNQNRNYYIALVICCIVFLSAIFYLRNANINQRISTEKTNLETLKKQNSELTDKRTKISDQMLKTSYENAKISNKLTKSISNEKPVIKDTNYFFMSKFILDYRPN